MPRRGGPRVRPLPPIPETVMAPTGPVAVVRVVELQDEDGTPCAGLWTPVPRQIALDQGLSLVDAWWTLWHEWTHAVLYDQGVRIALRSEERVCDALAMARMLEMQGR